MSSSGMNGIPGANAMGDTLEFVKSLWGSMKIPGMTMPSMSPEEIDKQIADLKAVESWLQMNMNMLRGSIQALEVQSATLSTLRSMSETFAQAASGASGAAGAMGNMGSMGATGAAAAAAADDKPSFDSPFTSARARPSEPDDSEPSAEPNANLADLAGMAAPFANPAIWWNAVQDQFQQAVSQAVAPASKPASKSRSTKKKPAASKGAAGTNSGSAIRNKASSKAGSESGSKDSSKDNNKDGNNQGKQGTSTRRRRKPGESA